MSTYTNALELSNVTKSFPGFYLDHINLSLPKGCIMGLIGENGAGKSTTIKLILDMLHKDSGSITILGKDHTDNLKLTKEDIGVVMDEVGLPDCLNTKQVNRLMKHTFSNWDSAEYNRLLQKLSIPDPVVRDEVIEMFYEFTRNEEHSILISSHMNCLFLW